MRKILVVVGSGLSGGNTDRLADAFVKGATEAGHEVRKIFLGKGDLHGCRGCGACQIGSGCVIQDVMQEVYPAFDWCDTIVVVSPLYFWTVSSQTKAFIDRLYAVSRNDGYPVKDTALLMTAGDNEKNTFDINRIPAQAREVFHNDAVHMTSLNIREHLLKTGTVEIHP